MGTRGQQSLCNNSKKSTQIIPAISRSKKSTFEWIFYCLKLLGPIELTRLIVIDNKNTRSYVINKKAALPVEFLLYLKNPYSGPYGALQNKFSWLDRGDQITITHWNRSTKEIRKAVLRPCFVKCKNLLLQRCYMLYQTTQVTLYAKYKN